MKNLLSAAWKNSLRHKIGQFELVNWLISDWKLSILDALFLHSELAEGIKRKDER